MSPLRSEKLDIAILESPQGVRILKLTGQLTLQTLFDFQDTGREDVAKPVIIDMTGMSYMDSAGLGCILGVFASCQRTKRGFALIGLSDRVRTLFKVTKVDGLLPCFSSLEGAEAAVLKAGS